MPQIYMRQRRQFLIKFDVEDFFLTIDKGDPGKKDKIKEETFWSASQVNRKDSIQILVGEQ
jgi:hypothetical protein